MTESLDQTKGAEFPIGTFICADLLCRRECSRLKSASDFATFLSSILADCRFNELGSYFHQFEGAGFTGVVSLAESHIAIHTWPELGRVTLDLFVCNHSRDNSFTARRLFSKICDWFEPSKVRQRTIRR